MKVRELLNSEVSVFGTVENTGSSAKMAVSKLSDVLMLGDRYVNQIEDLRRFAGRETADIEKQYKERKSKLPVFTSSCLCGNGAKDIVTVHNILCIDIDFQDNEGMDAEQAKERLIQLPSVFYTSLSVGGKGVFALIGLSGSEDFKERFNSVKEYIYKKTGYVIDKSCCNPNRLRFISYDSNCLFKDLDSELVLYPNKKSEVQQSSYKPLIDISLPKQKSKYDEVDLLNDDKFCIACADYCINRLGLKTTDYTNWISHIGSLTTLGIEGERLAIQLSQQSKGYKSDNDVLKTMRSLSVKGNQRQFITRYFKMCKERLGKYWIAEIKKLYELDDNTQKLNEINFENHTFENL